VLIENRPALDVLRDHDTPDTLFYVDPPYVHETRKLGSKTYRHEMSDAEHRDLLAALLDLDGMVVLSGYPHPIYDKMLAGWHCITREARIAAGRGTALRTEALWLSPRVEHGIGRLDFRAGEAA